MRSKGTVTIDSQISSEKEGTNNEPNEYGDWFFHAAAASLVADREIRLDEGALSASLCVVRESTARKKITPCRHRRRLRRFRSFYLILHAPASPINIIKKSWLAGMAGRHRKERLIGGMIEELA
ncbi:hypothetical protein Ddc_07428 [Ditylenchus destructor]|nr:hypothetical protein Ddc_07428 [Ditylenchus destructor]